MFKEAKITINGIELTSGEAMTVRVAISSFVLDLRAGGLGDESACNAILKKMMS